MLSRIVAAALVLAVSVTVGEATAATPTASIHWSGADIAVPIPQGYCLPDGPYIDLAAKIAQTDQDNVTLLTLFDCEQMNAGGAITRPITIKALRKSFGETVSRPEFLGMFKNTPQGELADAMKLKDASANGSKEASRVFGKDVQLDLKFQPVGTDEYATYMAGIVQAQSGDQSNRTAAGVALTTIKSRPLFYYVFLPGGGVGDVEQALSQAKANVRAWIKANEP